MMDRTRMSGGVALAILLMLPASGRAASPSHWCAYVANASSHSISVVDGAGPTVKAEIALPSAPRRLAFDAANAAIYVLISTGTETESGDDDGHQLLVVDARTFETVREIPLPAYTDGFALLPSADRAYVAADFPPALVPIDLVVPGLLSPISMYTYVKERYAQLAVSPDGLTVYVPLRTEVLRVETSAGRISQVAGSEVGEWIKKVVLGPDGRTLYILLMDDPSTSDWLLRAVDVITGNVSVFPALGEASGVDMVLSPDGARLYLGSSHLLAVVDLRTNSIRSVPVEGTPLYHLNAMAVAPDNTLYVVYSGDSYRFPPIPPELLVLDPTTGSVKARLAVGERPVDILIAETAGDCVPSSYTPPPPTATRTPVPTSTPEPPCGSGKACLQVGSATLQPGASATVDVVLRTAGRHIAGIQNDLVFQPPITVTTCSRAGSDSELHFAHLTQSVLRALVLKKEADFVDGEVLYTCTVTTPADATPGTFPLVGTYVVASDASGERVASGAEDGAVHVISASEASSIGLSQAAGDEGTSAAGCAMQSGFHSTVHMWWLIGIVGVLIRRRRSR